ncbi:MAG: PilX N-terminal domain-containing pilus assembly protein [Gammaproteobacteria bacterium]|nr:PilX N-terminal domain-containing pilus assembly protein [Gammaproteobacteria bacterium]
MTHTKSYRRHALPHTQRGAATLVTSLILLLAITLMTFSSARVVVVEQRIAANDYRAKQALHAAQAALERAVYNSNLGAPSLGTATTGVLPGSTSTIAPCTVAGICYRYVYDSVLTPVNTALLSITATGWSDDGSATKTVIQYIKKYSLPSFTPPNAPVQSGSAFSSTSQALTITNGETGTVIEAQGLVQVSGNPDNNTNPNITYQTGTTTTVATTDPGGGLVQNSTTDGVTGTVDSTAEGEAFFQSIFGASKYEIQNMSLPVTCGGVCNPSLVNSGANTSSNSITYGTPIAPYIWVTGDTTINAGTIIGSPTNPVVLVVDGGLRIEGGATIHGFIYSTGSTTKPDTVLTGTANIVGAVASEGDMIASGGGALTISFNSFGNNSGGNGPEFYVKVPGTWIDN